MIFQPATLKFPGFISVMAGAASSHGHEQEGQTLSKKTQSSVFLTNTSAQKLYRDSGVHKASSCQPA